MAQSPIQLLLGAVAILSILATAVLLFILAGSTSQAEHQSHFILLLASASVEFILCISLTILLIRHRLWTARLNERKQASRWTQQYAFLLLIGVLPSLIATSVVAATVGVFTMDRSNDIVSKPIPAFFTVSFAIWILSVLAQAAYFAVLAVSTKLTTQAPLQRFPIDDPLQEVREISRPDTGTTDQSSPFQAPAPSSPPSMTMSASEADSSLRSSFSTIQRPGSSKRALLGLPHSLPRHSAQSSFDTATRRPSQDEGFDSWDLSGVSAQMRETVLQKGVGLPTIPGSRSPSPAKALEGPFFNPSPDDSPPQSPLPQPPISRPTSPPSSAPELSKFTSVFPAALLTPIGNTPPSSPLQSQRPRYSRPPSLPKMITSEDHIHPLFRTCSPTPPPSASSNTVVTAAPEAGEMINRQTLHRMRSCSQPSSSSPLVRSESVPDIRNARGPLLSISCNISSPATSPRPGALHQRKRSASFEGCIIRD